MTLLIRELFLFSSKPCYQSFTSSHTFLYFGNSFQGRKNGTCACFLSLSTPSNSPSETVQALGCHPPVLIELLLQLQKLLDFFCLLGLKCVNNMSPRCTQYCLGYYHQPHSWLCHFPPTETRCLSLKSSPIPQPQSSHALHLLSQLDTATSHQ